MVAGPEKLFIFFWRIPQDPQDRDENKGFPLQAECLSEITTSHSRVKRAVFFSTIASPSCIGSKADASVIYMHLKGDQLPHNKGRTEDSAILMAAMALATQDFDIAHDLRILNERPKSPVFDMF